MTLIKETNLGKSIKNDTFIELLLNYCHRFYDRQFIARSNVNSDILVRFEKLLNDYFKSDKASLLGLPSVINCADEPHLSSNYFGDLIKKETGMTSVAYRFLN